MTSNVRGDEMTPKNRTLESKNRTLWGVENCQKLSDIIYERSPTIKNATFDISKNILGPVHLLDQTDKWEYL